ncbi:MAG: AraC family transcriptional regulator [Proteobacteria bacterium]|nr:AraC family transcriptional regulator [Pseudomonadota bacterium]
MLVQSSENAHSDNVAAEGTVMRTLSDLIDKLLSFAKDDGIYRTPIPRLTIIRHSEPTVPELVLYAPALCVVAQGAKEARLDNRSYRYDAAHYLLGSVQLPVLGAVVEATKRAPFVCLRLDLDSMLVAELLELATLPDLRAKALAGLELGAMDDELLDAIVRLADVIHRTKDVAVLAPLIEREVIWRLFQYPESAAMLARMVTSGSRLREMTKVISWLEQHFGEPATTSDLAALAGMSLSSFHQHFRAVTGTSPLRFRNRLRLMAARRLMVVKGYEAAEAGFAVGYQEPSQFSREYSRQFGLPPKRDAERLRRSGLAEIVTVHGGSFDKEPGGTRTNHDDFSAQH